LGADCLFVYGTLRRGSNNKFARLLEDRAQFLGAARVPGRLYDLGPYPGAVASNQPDDRVHGELHRLTDPQLLPLLDDYEGAEFERASVAAQTENGERVECWIYWYRGAEKGRRILSGDWFLRV